MASLAQEIHNGNIKEVYLFYGEEAFKRRYYKKLLIKAVTDGNAMNLNIFEGKNIEWKEVYDATQTLPFFADRRLVIIENSGKLQTGAGSADADGLLEKTLEELPPHTCLVFLEEAVAKNRKLFKIISAKGAVLECSRDTEEDVLNWLARGFARDGKRFRRSTLELLIRRVGTDYDRLRMEAEKVISYVGERTVIEDADVLAVSCETVESRVFEMTKAMCQKNVPLVLDRYRDLLINREAPMRILGALRSELRTMLQVSDLMNQGRSNREIAKAVGKPEFVIRDITVRLRRFRDRELEEMLDQAAEFDSRCKSGDVEDKTGLELLLIQFSS